MKITAILLFLCCCITCALAQPSSEFGLVVKSGTYNLPPFHYNIPSYQGSTTTVTQKLGNSFIFGARQSLRFDGHFRVSFDFLFRYVSYATIENLIAENTHNGNLSGIKQGQIVSESSVSVPINFYFSPIKDGRTSIHVGWGLSNIVRTELYGTYESWSESNPQLNVSFPIPSSIFKGKKFTPKGMMTAGLQHRLSEKTAIGLEFNFERRPESSRFFPSVKIDKAGFPNFSLEYLDRPNLKSLSVSLYHALTR